MRSKWEKVFSLSKDTREWLRKSPLRKAAQGKLGQGEVAGWKECKDAVGDGPMAPRGALRCWESMVLRAVQTPTIPVFPRRN